MRYLCHATELSDYIVDKCYDDGRELTNLSLQHMLYIIQIAYCSVTRGRLLFPDRFVATDYGPKIPEVRDRYNPFLCTPISGFTRVVVRDDDIRNFIDDGMRFVSATSPWRLNEVMMETGSPWHRAYLRDEKTIDYNEFVGYYSTGRFDLIGNL